MRCQLVATDYYRHSRVVLLLRLQGPAKSLILAMCELSQLSFLPKVCPALYLTQPLHTCELPKAHCEPHRQAP